MSKRVAEGEPGGTEPPAKRIVFEPLQLGSITNLEELDVKTLQFQNRFLHSKSSGWLIYRKNIKHWDD